MIILSIIVLVWLSISQVVSFQPLTSRNRALQKTTRLSASSTSSSVLASDAAASTASRLKRVSRLTSWGEESGIKIGGLQVGESSGGLGLIATQDLKKNDILMTVPSNVALAVESPGEGPVDARDVLDLVTDRSVLRDQVPWFAQFAVYLYGLDQVSSSRTDGLDMRPWLDSLPRRFDTPLHWASTEALQYNHLTDAVARQTSEWKRLHDTLMSVATPALQKMTWDDFCWGCECARSRAFSGAYTGSAFNPLTYAFTLLLVTAYVGLNLGTLEQAANGAALVLCAQVLKDFVVPKLFKKKRYCICPIIDMANHQSLAATGEVSFEFFGDAYSLAATDSVRAGQEVYISYGARSNDQLLQYYGFVEPQNPHDVYIMPPLREWNIDALEQACGRKFANGRLQKLDRAGLLGGTMMTEENASGEGIANPKGGVVISRAGGLDPAVMQALRALVSSDEEWAAAGEAIGNFSEELSGGPENERVAKLAAKTAIELELKSKPTSIAEDKALLKRFQSSKSLDSSAEEILPILFRIEKKKLLEETISKLQ